MNKKEAEKKIGPRYKCIICGRIWRSGKIMVVCPVCRCKPVKLEDGVAVEKIIKIIKRR